MHTRFVLYLLAVCLLSAPIAALAQEKAPPSPQELANKRIEPSHYYRLDFLVRELDQGKVLNQRSYSLGVAAAGVAEGRDWWSLRAGTKLQAGSSYVDVGFNVDVRAEDVGNALQLRIKADLSSVPTDGSGSVIPSSSNAPATIRQMRAEEAVLVPIGKPTIVFSSEDPTSKHQFQIEVTAVPQK